MRLSRSEYQKRYKSKHPERFKEQRRLYRIRNSGKINERRRKNRAAKKVPKISKFSHKYIPEPFSGCWLWCGGFHSNGYGAFSFHGTTLAHRASWMIHNGLIPSGMSVLHRCDTRPCVNPNHLFLGTQSDNVQDACLKWRMHYGESNGMAKLTSDSVQQIRSSPLSHKEAASEFGVNRGHICAIRLRRRWRHI